MKDEIKEILDKFDKVLENYELEKKWGQMSVDSICHLFHSEMMIIKDYITNLQTIEQQYSALLSENAELQNKYNKALETLVEYSMPCERDNFNLLDTDYCELNCSNDDEQFKKCWDKFIEWKIKDEQRNCSNK